jgi:hypothetical protein
MPSIITNYRAGEAILEQQKSDGWLDRELHAAVTEVNSWPPEERAATPAARFKAAAEASRSASGPSVTKVEGGGK